jgi:uncharacterized membrane protein YkvA (DUF1232 family)
MTSETKPPAPPGDAEYRTARAAFIRSILYVGLGVVYWLWPVDVIPDVLVGPGIVDDGLVLASTVLHSGFRYVKLRRGRNKGA